MGTGVPPGLQNQSLGVSSVLGGFDSHILPPYSKSRPSFEGLFLYIILYICLFMLNMLGLINCATQQAVEILQMAKKSKRYIAFFTMEAWTFLYIGSIISIVKVRR